MSSERKIKITLEFSEYDLNQILAYCFLGDEAPEVKDMTNKQFTQFGKILQANAPAFVEEIIDGSGDSGDWLLDFMSQFE